MQSFSTTAPTRRLTTGLSAMLAPPKSLSLSRWTFDISCIRPDAPAVLSANGLKPDSTAITDSSSSGSMLMSLPVV